MEHKDTCPSRHCQASVSSLSRCPQTGKVWADHPCLSDYEKEGVSKFWSDCIDRSLQEEEGLC